MNKVNTIQNKLEQIITYLEDPLFELEDEYVVVRLNLAIDQLDDIEKILSDTLDYY